MQHEVILEVRCSTKLYLKSGAARSYNRNRVQDKFILEVKLPYHTLFEEEKNILWYVKDIFGFRNTFLIFVGWIQIFGSHGSFGNRKVLSFKIQNSTPWQIAIYSNEIIAVIFVVTIKITFVDVNLNKVTTISIIINLKKYFLNKYSQNSELSFHLWTCQIQLGANWECLILLDFTNSK